MKEPDLLLLKEHFERELLKVLHRPFCEGDFFSKSLNESIAYAFATKGKRLRPLLVLAMAEACQESSHLGIKRAMPVALAVEFIHTYSLIHDDLPAMDNDNFRRGRETLHRRFDEGLAILTGDALLADAFLFASSVSMNSNLICKCLAEMAGSRGLVAGQSEDLHPNNIHADLKRWLSINHAKTARMFETCAHVGVLSLKKDQETLQNARAFGAFFGHAFQMQDDLQDQAGVAKIIDRAELTMMLDATIISASERADTFSRPQILLDLLAMAFAK